VLRKHAALHALDIEFRAAGLILCADIAALAAGTAHLFAGCQRLPRDTRLKYPAAVGCLQWSSAFESFHGHSDHEAQPLPMRDEGISAS
jgi:hypothetical protein